jgi:hypothetical protein
MRLPVVAAFLCFCASLGVAVPVPGVDPTKVSLENIAYAGSGCKAGTVHTHPSTDWTGIRLTFDNYKPSIGPSVPFAEKRKNCNVGIKIRYPPGYQYTLYQLELSRRWDLEAKAKYYCRSTYWFTGFATRATLQVSLAGPFTGYASVRDTLPDKSLVWSPCGGSATLNINTEVSLESSSSQGMFSPPWDPEPEEPLQAYYGISWRKC